MRKKPHGADDRRAPPMIAVHRKGEKPLHRQIYDAFRAMILERRLQPGQQIPSTRALADELGISRIPVLGAYAQLLAEGYIESRSGAGTFVTSSLSDQFLSARPAGERGERSSHPTPFHASPGFCPWRERRGSWVRALSASGRSLTIIFRFASGPTW
jgi:GntR family transcriptional regulator/MocR family aminotransferase